MADLPFGCAICGAFIYNQDGDQNALPWLNTFRGIYRDSVGIHTTGVGCKDENQRLGYVAPKDTSARWDDPEYDQTEDSVEFGTMTQRSINGRYGFIFHDSCFSLLEEAFQPNKVPIQRLFDVLLSTPIAWDSLDWDHTYGGIYQQLDLTYAFPWEPRGFVFRPETNLELHDPYQNFNLSAEAPEYPPLSMVEETRRSTEDLFLRFPLEILLMIAERMGTSEVLKMRTISRAFGPVFHAPSFWHSRFREGGERFWTTPALGPYKRD
ncbi:unnamed protein product [Clonostachys rosea]|uniref:F-box domain-containing protein n=1 Tax=Bionectria ochroleuca TaxID=29856 RepID=A0ABY6V011_BIOOC|nr:unnamed protein product [Clonostachys rosea]